MTGWRKRLVAILAACGTAAAAGIALAANDPSGLDLRDEDGGRPSSLIVGPDAATPLVPATERPLRGNPLWGVPLDALRATRERPLFSPSRRPPMAAVIAPPVQPVKYVAPPAESDQPPLNLVGVVTGGTEGYAVFINTATHDVVRLRTGEGRDGWILQSVSGREVVLEKNHHTAVEALPAPTEIKK